MSRARRAAEPQKKDAQWDFFSFPVYFAFFAGMLLSVLLLPAAPIVFVVSLFGVSFCTAHAISRWFRNRGRDKLIERAEVDERERRAVAASAASAREAEAASPAAARRRRRRPR